MTTTKSKSQKISDQVKEQLHEKGYSFLFNYNDYATFKKQCKNAWNKAQAITEKFLEENVNQNSDYNEYIF